MVWLQFQLGRQTRRSIVLGLTLRKNARKKIRERYRYRLLINYTRRRWSLELSTWGDTECREFLRFTKAEIRELVLEFDLNSQDFMNTMKYSGYPATGEKALYMLLYRLAWPTRLKDMMLQFGCSRSYISTIVKLTVNYLYQRYHRKLFWDPNRLTLNQLQQYEMAISSRGCSGIWGFIDGTVRPIARPKKNQEDYYSGHKGYHGIKYQGIVTPDGLISSLYGPMLGPDGDWKLWKECKIKDRLREIFTDNSEPILYLYGDAAYFSSYGIMCPYNSRGITARQDATNVELSSL